jgi:hypothetical protein
MKFHEAFKIYKEKHPGTSASIRTGAKKGTEVYEGVMKILKAAREEKAVIPKNPRQLAAIARHAREDKEFKEKFAESMAAPRAMSFKEAFAARDAAAPKKRVFKVASAAAEARLAADAAPAAPKKRVFKVVKDAPADAAPAAPKKRVFKVVKKPEQVEEEVTEKPKMSTTVLAANIRAYKAKNIENEG